MDGFSTEPSGVEAPGTCWSCAVSSSILSHGPGEAGLHLAVGGDPDPDKKSVSPLIKPLTLIRINE